MILGNRSYDDDIGRELLTDIVKDDVYGIRHLDPASVRHVLDIGANVGFFAVYARMLYPRAKIVAVEPHPEIYAHLVDNCAELEITTCQAALGDGKPMTMEVVAPTDHTRNRVGRGTAGVEVPTRTLSQFVSDFDIDPTYCVFKFDCEGGEKYLLDDLSGDILHRAHHIGIEFHQDATGIPFPSWKTWLHRIAGERHIVDDHELTDTPDPWRMARVFTPSESHGGASQ